MELTRLVYASTTSQQFDLDAMDKILESSRKHTNIKVIEMSPANKRMFGSWDMAYIPIPDLLLPLNLTFMGSKRFNPYELSPSDINDFFFQLSTQLPRAHRMNKSLLC